MMGETGGRERKKTNRTDSGRRIKSRNTFRARVEGSSREARRLAAVVLEVLAGTRTTVDASSLLGVSLPRYYALEGRALEGLLSGCEPGRRKRGRSPAKEMETLRGEVERLSRDVQRYQALARAAQRTVGVPEVKPPGKKQKGSKKRRRKPVARALSLANRLQSEEAKPDTTSAEAENG